MSRAVEANKPMAVNHTTQYWPNFAHEPQQTFFISSGKSFHEAGDLNFFIE